MRIATVQLAPISGHVHLLEGAVTVRDSDLDAGELALVEAIDANYLEYDVAASVGHTASIHLWLNFDLSWVPAGRVQRLQAGWYGHVTPTYDSTYAWAILYFWDRINEEALGGGEGTTSTSDVLLEVSSEARPFSLIISGGLATLYLYCWPDPSSGNLGMILSSDLGRLIVDYIPGSLRAGGLNIFGQRCRTYAPLTSMVPHIQVQDYAGAAWSDVTPWGSREDPEIPIEWLPDGRLHTAWVNDVTGHIEHYYSYDDGATWS